MLFDMQSFPVSPTRLTRAKALVCLSGCDDGQGVQKLNDSYVDENMARKKNFMLIKRHVTILRRLCCLCRRSVMKIG